MSRCFFFALVISAATTLSAASPPVDERVRLAWTLVDALGDEQFAVREVAQHGLYALGRASIEPLEFAIQSDDSEVRLRATELLIALRGRGFLGIGMVQVPDPRGGKASDDSRLPFSSVKVNLCQPSMPAEAAGVLTGDTILSINGKCIQDVNELQKTVFSIGPARVISMLIERSGERLILPILLTLNTTPTANAMTGYVPVRLPPVNLESDLQPEARRIAPDANGQPQAFPGFANIPPLPADILPQDGQLVATIEAKLKLAREVK